MSRPLLIYSQRWISGQVIGILGNEDDVVIDFIFGMLEEERFVSFTFAHTPHPTRGYMKLLRGGILLIGPSLIRKKYKSISQGF